jgi:hypothetical protein
VFKIAEAFGLLHIFKCLLGRGGAGEHPLPPPPWRRRWSFPKERRAFLGRVRSCKRHSGLRDSFWDDRISQAAGLHF